MKTYIFSQTAWHHGDISSRNRTLPVLPLFFSSGVLGLSCQAAWLLWKSVWKVWRFTEAYKTNQDFSCGNAQEVLTEVVSRLRWWATMWLASHGSLFCFILLLYYYIFLLGVCGQTFLKKGLPTADCADSYDKFRFILLSILSHYTRKINIWKEVSYVIYPTHRRTKSPCQQRNLEEFLRMHGEKLVCLFLSS